jgi:hypothetical protein
MSEPRVDQTEPTTQGEPAAAALVCEADVVQLELPADQDPFGACLQVAGLHSSGTELVVWLRLTPTTIDRLVDQLREVLHDQQTALGVAPDAPAPGDVDDGDVEVEWRQDPAGAGESRVRRFLDPLGLRHVKARSPRSTVILAAAIAALMLLAFVVSMVRG